MSTQAYGSQQPNDRAIMQLSQTRSQQLGPSKNAHFMSPCKQTVDLAQNHLKRHVFFYHKHHAVRSTNEQTPTYNMWLCSQESGTWLVRVPFTVCAFHSWLGQLVLIHKHIRYAIFDWKLAAAFWANKSAFLYVNLQRITTVKYQRMWTFSTPLLQELSQPDSKRSYQKHNSVTQISRMCDVWNNEHPNFSSAKEQNTFFYVSVLHKPWGKVGLWNTNAVLSQ